MSWQITFATDDGEKVVNLDDLSPEVFEKIAMETDDGLSYWGVYQFPKQHPETLYRVICAAAEYAGIEPPPKAETMRDLNEQAERVTPAPDILKSPAMNGLPQVPSETEGGSSSTSLGLPTPGPQTSPDDNPSETS